jgi:hypothetical protein
LSLIVTARMLARDDNYKTVTSVPYVR